MSIALITALPLLAGFGLLYWSSLLDDDEWFLKLAFRFMFIPVLFLSIDFAIIDARLLYGADSVLVVTLTEFAYYFGWLLFGVGVYYCFVALNKAYDIVQQKKADKESAKYD